MIQKVRLRAFQLIHEMLISDLLPSHILLTAFIDRLFPAVTAHHPAELANRRVRSHVSELAARAFYLPLRGVLAFVVRVVN